jgi:hypothetical protein
VFFIVGSAIASAQEMTKPIAESEIKWGSGHAIRANVVSKCIQPLCSDV